MTTAQIQRIADRFQCTPEQARRQISRNIVSLRRLLGRADETGNKANGYTAAHLRERIAALQGALE